MQTMDFKLGDKTTNPYLTLWENHMTEKHKKGKKAPRVNCFQQMWSLIRLKLSPGYEVCVFEVWDFEVYCLQSAFSRSVFSRHP